MQDWLGAASPYYPFFNYYGYTDLGPVAVPPQPPICAMTDRTTGVVWFLGFDPANGNRLTISTTADTLPFSKLRSYRVFGAWDGPFIESYGLRMGVDNGRVVFEPFPGMDSGPGPYGFQLRNGNTQYAQVGATAIRTPSNLDHLTYAIFPLSP